MKASGLLNSAVVDLRMPGGSGLELVRDLKSIDPATKIIVLTGYGSIATALEAGEPQAQIKRRLRMPSRAADRLIADAHRAGAANLERTIEELADLELASRGGGTGAASEDTAALLALQRVAT